jgi:hypothetical protein
MGLFTIRLWIASRSTIADGYGIEKSIRRAIKKHKHDLEAFVEEAGEEDDDVIKEEEAKEGDSDTEEIQVGQGLSMDIIIVPIHPPLSLTFVCVFICVCASQGAVYCVSSITVTKAK